MYSLAASLTLFILAVIWINSDRLQEKSRTDFHDPIYAQLKKLGKIKTAKQMPNDWFYMQRAYPYESIPEGKYLAAIEEARELRKTSGGEKSRAGEWLMAGPTNIPGRITDLAVHPDYPNTIYAGSAAGGVFKSTDGGATWTAIFDDEGTQSIGALAIHPDNPNTIYVGTGEANTAGDSYEGSGIYKSTDGGVSWTHIGLSQSYHIGRILIDPEHPETVFVAASGQLFGTNPERGVYRSVNGGATWEQMYYIDDTTACIDIAIQPSTGTLLAAMWTRYRGRTHRIVGGVNSGIYRSTDYGETWTRLSNGLPAPADTVGRIGITIDSLSQTVYAIYCNHPGYFMGIYKSTDLGDSWTQTNDGDLYDLVSSFGWYFGVIRVVPGEPDVVFAMGVDLYRSTDGGASWSDVSGVMHVDHHAFYIHPTNAELIYDGCDGGINVSYNQGDSWTRLYDMPNTQFYAITIDKTNPDRLYGGTQDNGTMRTLTGGTDDWVRILGGDGFYTSIDYTDPDIIYAEYQWGYLFKSYDGGYYWYWALGNIDYEAYRHNWCTPFIMDPGDHNTLYYGANVLFKTTNGGDYWEVISGDLTNGPGPGNLTYGTITTIDVCPIDGSVIYVGTDDANVWVTTDGGGDWQNISAGLPDRWVTRVAVNPYDPAVAYVTFSGHYMSDSTPHIYRTENYGANWSDIHSNLPNGPINDVIVDPSFDSTLYVGSDVGVFYTSNLGQSWAPLGTDMPIAPVHDLDFNNLTRTLVAGTHGRSMYKIDVGCTGADSDGDGVPDPCDNCPASYNPLQEDYDYDSVGDSCDNCIDSVNINQSDIDSDLIGDVCDNCPDNYNPGQEDSDADGTGDACDCICGDIDGNGQTDMLDILYLISYLYKGGPVPDPPEAGDINDDDASNMLDILYLISYLYKGGPEPVCT
jgi:photosystem II stability/assembly factor-like uncharacterized protein